MKKIKLFAAVIVSILTLTAPVSVLATKIPLRNKALPATK